MDHNAAVIIPAAGFGTRMRTDKPKQYLLLDGVPILVRTVRAFLDDGRFSAVVVAVPAGHEHRTEELFEQFGLNRRGLRVVTGGKRRQDSVQAALGCLGEEVETVLVHDGARPLIDQATIDRCCSGVVRHGAVIAAVPVKDTVKRAHPDNRISGTVDRTSLWLAQTPQAVRRDLLELAFARNGDADVTDEASLLEMAGIDVVLVEGSENNIKITRPEDLQLAEKILSSGKNMDIRIGHGYDAHRFAEGRKLILGGVDVPHPRGLDGHSDADVVTHALCDALLGALGRGDIGRHFPDTDQTFAGIYSIRLLDRVMDLVFEHGYQAGNIDITIVCQAPRLSPFIEEMTKLLAAASRTETANVNIKATTTEKMGFTGRQEGISSHAVVLLKTRHDKEQQHD
jgi:2-C-methyl-D-erythritol 4-phosphate cytidylyltransferase/2-C-methyl-D-erythritol 2,4-cyclodiphosphate synthase